MSTRQKICFLSLIALLLFSITPTFSETISPYRLNPVLDISLAGAAAVGLGMTLFIEGNPGEQTPWEEILWIDRIWTAPYNGMVDKIGTAAACTALLLPGLSILGQGGDLSSMTGLALMYLEGFLIAQGIKDGLKGALSRWRPSTYDLVGEPEDEEFHNSFPSGHTTLASLGAAFLDSTFATLYPESPYRKAVSIGGWTLAGITGLLRIASGEHFLTDVLAGALIGGSIGYLIPLLHRVEEEESVQITPAPFGFTFSFSY